MSSKTIKQKLTNVAINQALKYIEGNPEENIPKLMDLVEKFGAGGTNERQLEAVRSAIDEKNNWYQLILRLYDLDPGVRKAVFQNLIINASLFGREKQEELAAELDCNIPWAMLLDPTSACNMQCKGCWAAEYGNQLNLSLETLDSIIRQGKEMGTYLYLYTGGEPLVRKKDIIKLCEMHPDCQFMSFTNGTLIDEEFCKEMLRVKNFVPAISLEGFEDATDGRRGDGSYKKMKNAMALLKEHKLPFGISSCYTSANIDSVSSEEYFDMMVESGAYFVWFFHYMPVGNDADVNLLPRPEQREKMCRAIREFRNTKPIFSIDFQNDAQYVKGCIAGGRRYIHINAKGDIEPCAFIHYADSNIHEHTILEALQRPLFMGYHKRQPFNENLFQPCPMLENPQALKAMVEESGAHSTDYQSPEDVCDLCNKCTPYAEHWKPTADKLWEEFRKK